MTVWVVTKDVYDGEGLSDPADEYVGLSHSRLGALGIVYEDGGPADRVYGDKRWWDDNVWHIRQDEVAP